MADQEAEAVETVPGVPVREDTFLVIVVDDEGESAQVSIHFQTDYLERYPERVQMAFEAVRRAMGRFVTDLIASKGAPPSEFTH